MKKKEFSFFLPLAVICIFTLFIFFKIFLKGLYPIPADLLVSFYFPWYSGGWEGYNPWTTHKELLNADAIRQIYLWKEFAISQFKNGQFPLWNPYTFSGQPFIFFNQYPKYLDPSCRNPAAVRRNFYVSGFKEF